MDLATTVTTPAPAPMTTVPKDPAIPAEIMDLANAPLFRGEYTAVEKDTWREGMPLFGTKATSQRSIAFTNEFNILRTSSPMIGYAAKGFDDAIRAASRLAYDWSDPAFGGQIYSSVGVAVFEATNGVYYLALVGSGNPRTSSGELGYRSDRFDDNIYGSFKKATDARTTSAWSQPVGKDGNPVDVPAPPADREIRRRDVGEIKLSKIVPSTPLLKAIVDVREVHPVG